MPTLTLRGFLAGPGAWRPASPWHPVAAVVVGVAIVLAGQAVPLVVHAVMQGGGERAGGPGNAGFDLAQSTTAALLLLLSQMVLAALTLLAAGLRQHRWAEVLSLSPPQDGARAYLYALIVMLPLVAAFNAVAYSLSPEGFVSDFKQFAGLAKAPDPSAAFLAIAAGAPLWEEMLFRGFLLAPLALALGFWPAAALVSAAWTILHIGYSAAGLTEVFLIGLYLSWLLWRTGSLWVPILCHAVYNGSLFLVLRHLPV